MDIAIKKLIPTGYFGDPEKMKKFNVWVEKKDESYVVYWDNGINGVVTSVEVYLMDYKFWKCLGKREQWDPVRLPSPAITADVGFTNWIEVWHSLIDHLANGGSIDDFFNKLLK